MTERDKYLLGEESNLIGSDVRVRTETVTVGDTERECRTMRSTAEELPVDG